MIMEQARVLSPRERADMLEKVSDELYDLVRSADLSPEARSAIERLANTKARWADKFRRLANNQGRN